MPHANIKRFTQLEQVQSFVFRYGEMCARSFWLEEGLKTPAVRFIGNENGGFIRQKTKYLN